MTKLAVISDTHGHHSGLQLPDADILIHCGDFSNHGTYMDALKFVNWFGAQPHKHKIFIAGNHDLYFEQGNPSDVDMFLRTMPKDVHYLQDSSVTLEGIKFWGSPVQPTFFNWAFNRDRGEAIKKHWDLIPKDIDVLITHGPAKNQQDAAPRGYGRTVSVGCEDLLHAIRRVKPKIHVFGHVHYSYGKSFAENVHYFNASICDENYIPCNKPYLLDLNGAAVNIIELL